MPTGDWTTFDEGAGLWTAEYRVPGIRSRAAALRLRDGSYVVYSPGPGLEEGFAAIGEPSFLLAPNSYHHLGLASWKRRFPKAAIAAAYGAHSRLKKQGVTGLENLANLALALPPRVELLEPPATRIGEVWIEVQSGAERIWLIGDSFFNMRPPRRRKDRLLQRVTKGGPGLAMSRLMKYGGLSNRTVFRGWIDGQLAARSPTQIVPLHGDVLSGPDLVDRMRAFVAQRLGGD